MNELTPQQKKGFELLENLIRSKYRWVDGVVIPDPFKYDTQMYIELVVNFRRLVKMFDIYDIVKERFDNDQLELDAFTDQRQCWSWLFTLVYGSIKENKELFEEGELFNDKFNQRLEKYITLMYSKLPRNITMLVFNGDEERYKEELPYGYSIALGPDVPDELRDERYRKLFEPKEILISCYKVSPGSASDLLGGM